MIDPHLKENEHARMVSLLRLNLLDTAPEKEFDDLVLLATDLCSAPIGGITLIDSNRQWFKAKIGLDISETSRKLAFCSHTIDQQDALIIPDAINDQRFTTNTLVTEGPKIRAYAGIPLKAVTGHRIGTIWVGDRVPRTFSETEIESLGRLAGLAEALLRLKHYLSELHAALQTRDQAFSRLRKLEDSLKRSGTE